MSEWIKIEERRPKNEERVLVTVKEGVELESGGTLVPMVFTAHYYESGEIRWYPIFSIEYDGSKVTDGISAWMPMIEAYTEEVGTNDQ